VVVGLDAPAVGDAVLRYLGRAWAQAERGQ
jgi:hypothetical protein